MALRPRDGEYFHIEIERQPEEPIRRKRNPFFRPIPTPPNRIEHATALEDQTVKIVDQTKSERESLGMDPGKLLVLEFKSVNYDAHDDFVDRFGATVVDESVTEEEDQSRVRTVVQFPTGDAIQKFQNEILAYRGGAVQQPALPPRRRENLFDALQSVGGLSPEDRMGRRLKEEGFPEAEPFFLDVDLWRPDAEQGAAILAEFRRSCERGGCQIVDQVHTESLLLLKVHATREFGEQLLRLDLVARVDLPPRVAAGYSRFFEDFPPLNPTQEPDEQDPILCVIDSGVISGHPFLRGWVVAERDFETGENTEVDQNGHGTSVAGLAVYGDIAACMEIGEWRPKVRVCSAKVLRNESNPIDPDRPRAVFPDEKRIEHTIEESIRHFHDEWGCRVFNLSVGDDHSPYVGGRQFPWAEKLDELARELNIVIAVAAGNRWPEIPNPVGNTSQIQEAVRDAALASDHRICNPGTSALSLTVGSVARNDATIMQVGGRPFDLHDAIPGAPKGGPSPFTCTGPGCSYRAGNECIKPELADYGGNCALQQVGPGNWRWNDSYFLMGEPTIIREQNGRFIGAKTGTSFACPHVAHAAALAEVSLKQSLGRQPSANLIKALVASGAQTPECGGEWLIDEGNALRLVGYGQPSLGRVVWSSEGSVQLTAESELEEEKLHFYQIPIPESFLATSGQRGISIALAYDPPVRSSRKEYLSRTMFLEAFQGLTPQEVALYRSKFEGTGNPPSLPSGAALDFRPPRTQLQWSTLQVRRIEWKRAPRWRADSSGQLSLHVVVGCQARFRTGMDPRQSYALVINFWHLGQDVRLYQELRNLIRQPVRVRVQPVSLNH